MKKYFTAITVAASLFVAPFTASANNVNFSDVNSDMVHYEAIMNLAEKGVVDGEKDGNFHPWDKIYRGQLAKIMVETKGFDGTVIDSQEVLAGYKDVGPISDYANNIATATKAGIFKGKSDTFGTYDHLTREQMATVLVRAFHLDELDSDKNVSINLSNVSKPHRNAVQTLADLGITKELDDFHAYNKITRAELASFLDRALDVKASFPAGSYKVGKDIPSGEYLIFSPGSGYYEAMSDSTGDFDSIIFNGNVPSDAHSYVTLKDGEYFQLKNASMYPVESAPSVKPKDGTYTNGMYKVGKDIPAGEYKVYADSDMDGYIEVNSDSRHRHIVTNDNFQNDTYITVSEGQYLTLKRARIER